MACNILDKDQSFIVHDYGPTGYIGSASIILQYGMKPGAIISVVSTTSDVMEICVRDIHGNWLIDVANRANEHDFGLQCRFDGKFDTEEKIKPYPTHRGVRSVTTLLYQEEGYRVFINEKEVAFFKHRSKNPAHLLYITQAQIFKIIYVTVRDIIP